MNAVSIQHLRRRTEIRGAGAAALRERVDVAFAAVLDDGLEVAFHAHGIGLDEDICIRRLHTRNRLQPGRSDAQWAADLSLTWIEEVRRMLARGGPDVVRYRSRLHALVDIAVSVQRGDRSREWAWRQLREWREEHVDAAQAIEALVDTLTCHETAVVPVLAVLAARGALAPLAARLNEPQVVALALAALAAAGAPRELLGAAASASDAETEQVERQAARALAASPLAPAIATHAPPGAGEAAAVLVLLGAEPAVLRGRDARRIVVAGARRLRAARSVAAPAPNQPAGREQLARRPPAPSTAPTDADAPQRDPTEARLTVAGASDGPPQPVDGAAPALRGRSAEPVASAVDAADDAGATTGWGGLLLLLPLVEPSGVLELATTDDALQSRGLPWTLHRLATLLAPIPLDDPAALAFAGVAASAAPPLLGSEAPTVAEQDALAHLGDTLVVALRERLGDVGAATHPGSLGLAPRLELAQDLLLHTICRRAARIRFDPGWIEVRFRLADVSIAIRRCGLDRNPDWLPWLGAVVRYVYE
ncbi:MAG TPA: hypothetical protein VE907_07065 [Gammaproteobacteria bacterium]|nr:hypothetical protein [Gammaproteobacteria bacterium]